MVQQTQTRVIRIKVDASGSPELRRFSRQMARVNQNTKRTAVSLGQLRTAFIGFAGAIGLREITRAVDSFQLLQDRITVFTGSAEKATDVFEDLRFAAKFTRTSVDSLGESYNRLALATQELGLNSDQILASTVALQQTFRLSGSTIAESTAATIQLAQGLSSGQLRGQELRSVLEQNAVFVTLLAEKLDVLNPSLDVTRGRLIKIAESGAITNDVVLSVLADSFDELNDRAAKLGITFEQALIIGIDAVVAKLSNLNKSFGISKLFAEAVETIVNNIDILASAFVGLTTLILINVFPKIIAGFKALAVAIGTNPIGAILVGLSTVVTLLAINWETSVLRMEKLWLQFRKVVIEGAIAIFSALKPIDDFLRRLTGSSARTLEEFLSPETSSLAEVDNRLSAINSELSKTEKGLNIIQRFSDQMKELRDSIKKGQAGVEPGLVELNLQFSKGLLTIEAYRAAVANIKLGELNTKFRTGKVDVDEYRKSVLQLTQDLSDLDSVSRGVEDGLTQVARNAGNVAANISTGIQNTFRGLEDTIVEFVKTGQFEFKKFTEAVLEDLTRIILRAQLIAPLANVLTGSIGASAVPTTSVGSSNAGGLGVNALANANGNAFGNGNVIPFANGGVVGSPTTFGMSGGRTGLMGEAGPEAILPLERGSDGKLGVKGNASPVTVNIINNAGADVEQRERVGADGNRTLDVLIKGRVQDGISRGDFDSALGETFGLRRRGR